MNNRLNQFLAAENLTQAEFAKRLGIARAGVSHILQGRNSPSYSFILAMMNNFPALNIEWLISGKGKMYKEQKSQITADAEPLTANLRLDTSDGMLFPVAEEDERDDRQTQPENQQIFPTRQPQQSYRPDRPLQTGSDSGNIAHAPGIDENHENLKSVLEDAETRKYQNLVQNGRKENSSIFSKEIKKIVVFFTDNTFEEFKGI